MRLLLDTHSFLWFTENNPKLSSLALSYLQDTNNQIFLSFASVWELAIKISTGRFVLNLPFETFFSQQLQVNRIALLEPTISHAAVVALLPYHHRDPFDRMIISQAVVEQIPILSAGTAFDAYGVTRLW
jgi:PIN domain nuclease of toxin-antitoxin system